MNSVSLNSWPSGDRVDYWLELFSLEEILERADLEPRDVLIILLRGGHISFPDYLEETVYDETT